MVGFRHHGWVASFDERPKEACVTKHLPRIVKYVPFSIAFGIEARFWHASGNSSRLPDAFRPSHFAGRLRGDLDSCRFPYHTQA